MRSRAGDAAPGDRAGAAWLAHGVATDIAGCRYLQEAQRNDATSSARVTLCPFAMVNPASEDVTDRRQLNVHRDRDVTSFTKIRFPEIVGCAQVALSATL